MRTLSMSVILSILVGLSWFAGVSGKSYTANEVNDVGVTAYDCHIQLQRGTNATVNIQEVFASDNCTVKTEVHADNKLELVYGGEGDNVCTNSLLVTLPTDFNLKNLRLKGGSMVLRMNGVDIDTLHASAANYKMEALGNTKEVDGKVARSVIDHLEVSGASNVLVIKNYDVAKFTTSGAVANIDLKDTEVELMQLSTSALRLRSSDDSTLGTVQATGSDSTVHIGKVTTLFATTSSKAAVFLAYGEETASDDHKLTVSVNSAVAALSVNCPDATTLYKESTAGTTWILTEDVKEVAADAGPHLRVNVESSAATVKIGKGESSLIQFQDSEFEIPSANGFTSAAMSLKGAWACSFYGILLAIGLVTANNI